MANKNDNSKRLKKTPRKPKPAKTQHSIKFWVLRIAITILVFVVSIVAYLDIKVRKEFEGQKWALPAHVYTRPMELYVGQPLQKQRLEQELKELGYQRKDVVDKVGTYLVNAQGIKIYQREFMFWDGLQPQQRITISFVNGHINNIRIGKEQAEIVRLEPRLFGSVSPLSHEDRTLLKLEDVPKDLINALLSIEDRQFYSHFGISPLGILRAMVRNITAGKMVQGGSTLTQQLVKNYYLNSERTISRKLTEMVMAILLEIHYNKQDILQAYLNEVYLSQAGNRAIHGFALGSQYFFGRPLQELELPELATLAGIIKGPTYYNPLKYPQRSLKRRNLVLTTMLGQGYITEEQFQQAQQAPLITATAKEKIAPLSYPAFMGFVRDKLKGNYQQNDLQNDGLKIYTTLNPRIQNSLEQAVISELSNIEKNRNFKPNTLQVAAVVIRTDNGEVAGMVGDRTPKFSGYNRALDAKRPVGSLIKPFVYLTALESPKRFSLATTIADKKIIVSQKGSPDWSPQNYDKKEHGNVMLIDALARSYNLATVNLGMQVGVENVIKTIKRLGYEGDIRNLPSVLLGAIPLSVLEVAQLYLSIASGGFKTPIKGIRSVLSNDNQSLARYSLQIDQVIEPEFNLLISYALQDVVRKGTARSVLSRFKYDYGLAGKTGTTDEYRDSWFAGFSGNYLTVVWVGRDDNKSSKLTGASGAGRVWSRLMSKIPMHRLDLNYTESLATEMVTYTDNNSDFVCQEFRRLPFAKQSLPLENLPCKINNEQQHFESKTSKPKQKSWFERLFGN